MITPRIIYGLNGFSELNKPQIIPLPLAATQTAHTEIGIGSWLTSDSNGLRATVTADTLVSYIVQEILLLDGLTPKNNRYLTATEAGSGLYLLLVTPVGGLTIEIEENLAGGAGITDAAIAAGTVNYTVAVTAIQDIAEGEQSREGIAAAHAVIKVASNSGNSSSTNKVLVLQPMLDESTAIVNAPVTNNAYGLPQARIWRASFVPAAAQQSQAA